MAAKQPNYSQDFANAWQSMADVSRRSFDPSMAANQAAVNDITKFVNGGFYPVYASNPFPGRNIQNQELLDIVSPSNPFPGRNVINPKLYGSIGDSTPMLPPEMQGPALPESQGMLASADSMNPAWMTSAPAPIPTLPTFPLDESAAGGGAGGAGGGAAPNDLSAYEARIRAILKDPQAAALQAELDKIAAARAEAAKQGVGVAQQQLDAFKMLPQQMDLSALAKLTDQWTGSNLAQAYNRPVSPMERMDAMYKLQNAVQKANTGISDTEMADLERKLKQKSAERTLGINTELAMMNKAIAEKGSSAAKAREDAMRAKQKADFRKEYAEKFMNAGTMVGSARQMAKMIRENGGKAPIRNPMFNALASQVLITYNTDVANLGALAGPDKELLDKVIGTAGDDVGKFVQNLVTQPGSGAEVLDSIGPKLERGWQNRKSFFDASFSGHVDDDYTEATKAYKANAYGSPTADASTSDPRIDRFMKDNNLTDRDEAVKILKSQGFLK